MSFVAVKWANDQDTPNPTSALLLLQIAQIADHAGDVRRLDVEYLERVAKQSRRSVFRWLSHFEEAGILTRVTLCYDESGAAVKGLKLHLDRSYSPMQETHSKDGGETGAEEEGSANLALPDEGGQCQGAYQAVPPVALPLSMSRKEDKIIPPYPPNGEAVEKGLGEEEEAEQGFEKFKRSYPFDATMSLLNARAAWGELSIKDRAKVLRWVTVYANDLKRRGGTRPLDAARWLRTRRFEEIEAQQTGKAQAQGLAAPRVYVVKGTRAWEAWLRAGHKPGLDHATGPDGKRNGWWMPTLWPPGADPPADGEAAQASAAAG